MKITKITYYDNLIIKTKENKIVLQYSSLSYDKEDSIDAMRHIVDFIISDDNNCTVDNFLDNYNFEFFINIIPSYHLEFENNKELKDYCSNKINEINKDNLYDFLLSISDSAKEVYDYQGNLMYGNINIDSLGIDPDIYISENDRGLNASLFKEGDIVIRKNYPNDLYIVAFAYDKNFIHDELPIHYTGTVFIAPLKDYKDEDDVLSNSIRYARSELIKIGVKYENF